MLQNMEKMITTRILEAILDDQESDTLADLHRTQRELVTAKADAAMVRAEKARQLEIVAKAHEAAKNEQLAHAATRAAHLEQLRAAEELRVAEIAEERAKIAQAKAEADEELAASKAALEDERARRIAAEAKPPVEIVREVKVAANGVQAPSKPPRYHANVIDDAAGRMRAIEMAPEDGGVPYRIDIGYDVAGELRSITVIPKGGAQT